MALQCFPLHSILPHSFPLILAYHHPIYTLNRLRALRHPRVFLLIQSLSPKTPGSFNFKIRWSSPSKLPILMKPQPSMVARSSSTYPTVSGKDISVWIDLSPQISKRSSLLIPTIAKNIISSPTRSSDIGLTLVTIVIVLTTYGPRCIPRVSDPNCP